MRADSSELFTEAPTVDQVDIVSAKLPSGLPTVADHTSTDPRVSALSAGEATLPAADRSSSRFPRRSGTSSRCVEAAQSLRRIAGRAADPKSSQWPTYSLGACQAQPTRITRGVHSDHGRFTTTPNEGFVDEPGQDGAAHRSRLFHGDPRRPRRRDGAAVHSQELRRRHRDAAVDGERVHDRLRRRHPDRGCARRPARSPPCLRSRPGSLHRRLGRLCARARRRMSSSPSAPYRGSGPPS